MSETMWNPEMCMDALLSACEAEVNAHARQQQAQLDALKREREMYIRAGWVRATARALDMLPVSLRSYVDFNAIQLHIEAGHHWAFSEGVPVLIDDLPVLQVNPDRKKPFRVMACQKWTESSAGGMRIRRGWYIHGEYGDARMAIGHAVKMARQLHEAGY